MHNFAQAVGSGSGATLAVRYNDRPETVAGANTASFLSSAIAGINDASKRAYDTTQTLRGIADTVFGPIPEAGDAIGAKSPEGSVSDSLLCALQRLHANLSSLEAAAKRFNLL